MRLWVDRYIRTIYGDPLATLFDHKILADLPADVMANPTLEGVRDFLDKETRTQNNLIILWLVIGIGLFVYSAIHIGRIEYAGLFMLGGGLLVAVLAYVKKRNLQMSDEEILDAIREHNEALEDLSESEEE